MPANGHERARPLWGVVVLGGAILLAVLGSRDHAGGWNDGSRLATVEALVDHGTLAIDRSTFVWPPQDPQRNPYHPDDVILFIRGTLDKLWINGHFYSDKSPVPALLMAGEYWLAQRLTGL